MEKTGYLPLELLTGGSLLGNPQSRQPNAGPGVLVDERFEWDRPLLGNLVELTFYLELPRDLLFPNNDVIVHATTEALSTQDRPRRYALAGRGRPIVDPDFEGTPTGRTWFRRVAIREGLPLFATDLAFHDERELLIGARSSRRHARRAYRRRPPTQRMVAACTLWLTREHFSRRAPMMWMDMRVHLETALGQLNDIVRSHALALHRPDLHVLHLGDFPSLVPFTLCDLHEDSFRCALDGTLLIHGAVADFIPRTLTDMELGSVHSALGVVARHPDQRPFIELVADAVAAFERAEWRSSIISLVTAVETLVASIVRAATGAVPEAGLKNLVQDHFVQAPRRGHRREVRRPARAMVGKLLPETERGDSRG